VIGRLLLLKQRAKLYSEIVHNIVNQLIETGIYVPELCEIIKELCIFFDHGTSKKANERSIKGNKVDIEIRTL
jgi:methionine aminopeptidase